MTKKRTRGPGRGQEDFTGDLGAALGAVQRERERRARAESAQYRARERYSPRWESPGGGRGPMRPFAVGWRVVEGSYETDKIETVAMGRTVMMGSSPEAVQARAARWCCRDAQRRVSRLGGGFQIRYIKELK